MVDYLETKADYLRAISTHIVPLVVRGGSFTKMKSQNMLITMEWTI